MSPSIVIKKFIKSIFQSVGIDIIRRKNSPQETLLGLREAQFSTIIDVGANNGQFASYVRKLFPRATIYCFEPLPESFLILDEWSKKQQEMVIPFNVAIGDKDGDVEMFLHEEHAASSSLLATTSLAEEYYPFTKGQQRVCVRQMTLDNALSEVQANLSSEILIKLDVQGYEDRVISGGSNIFSRATACILEVSLDNLYEGQACFKELLIMLDKLGYRYVGNLEQIYGEDGHVIYIDAVFWNESKIRK